METYACAHARMRAHTHIHTPTLSLSLSHSHTHIHTRAHTIYTQTHTNTHTNTRTHIHTYTRTHMDTHTRAHTHKHIATKHTSQMPNIICRWRRVLFYGRLEMCLLNVWLKEGQQRMWTRGELHAHRCSGQALWVLLVSKLSFCLITCPCVES
jgi:hypothetical protein